MPPISAATIAIRSSPVLTDRTLKPPDNRSVGVAYRRAGPHTIVAGSLARSLAQRGEPLAVDPGDALVRIAAGALIEEVDLVAVDRLIPFEIDVGGSTVERLR